MADDKKKETPQKQQHADPATIKCRVHRLNCDPTNAKVPITVNAVGRPNGKKIFAPGSMVTLSQAQVNNLVDAVDEFVIPIQEDSAIHESLNPLKAAQNQYPDHKISRDPTTGVITATKLEPHYSIEREAPGGTP
ncbi:hypothetical protein LCGC14_1896660 [marine sediment metagenome]|uniref:Uncharacterized protein n=1 Tax=marine sediment metagenome TaxID=412755 RepID=A0A0F9IBM3_9ZZZZ